MDTNHLEKKVAYKAFSKDFRADISGGYYSSGQHVWEVGQLYSFPGELLSAYGRNTTAYLNPLGVLSLFWSTSVLDTRFGEVKMFGEFAEMNDGADTRISAHLIRLNKELSLRELIKTAANQIKDVCGYYTDRSSRIISTTRNARIWSKITDNAQILSSGDNAQIVTSADNAGIYAGGRNAQIVVTDDADNAQIHVSERNAQIIIEGDNAQVTVSGDNARIASIGDNTAISSLGYSNLILTTGAGARITSAGGHTKIVATGDNAYIASVGVHDKIETSGNNCVISCIGEGATVRAGLGSLITLAVFKDGIPIGTKTELVDGERICPGVSYRIYRGEFCNCDRW